jgi:hypothetical protein
MCSAFRARLLHVVGTAADMGGQLILRGGQELALDAPPVEAREEADALACEDRADGGPRA